MATYDTKLISRKQVADGTTEFTLTRPENLEYRAGQFADFALSGSQATAQSVGTHCFSFVSAPFEAHLCIDTRMRDSAFKNAMRDMPDGGAMQFDGPFGDFTLHKNDAVPAVFVIGGIGITPVRSMIAQALHEGSGHHLTLLYANGTPTLAAFADELQQLAEQHANFRFVPVYSATDGHINAATIKQHVGDIAGSKYYLSGPEGMVKAMRALLLDVGADEDNLRTEEFDGY